MTGLHDVMLAQDLFNRADVIDVLMNVRRLLTEHGELDAALIVALLTRAVFDGRVNLEDDRQVAA